VERQRAVPNEGPSLKGQASRCPSVKSRGLVSAESCLFSFESFLAMNRKVRGRARSQGRAALKSLVSPTARVKGESQDYVQPGVTCQRSPSRRKGE
jgi:hypothetical protein